MSSCLDVDSYRELCGELLLALEGAPAAYRGQWSKLIARTKGALWDEALANMKAYVDAGGALFPEEPASLE